ncbi:MAG TPA: phenylalanine--tRNA ligase subunit beta, partial [Deltaproteobacteria bacterium]|nr:phenylalanine--tRNA ligase subunit beta [Deltaproteobacteria bacterium]
MKVSFNWLKEFVAVTASAEEVAARLAQAGLEVEGMTRQDKGLEKVVTATLLQVEKHPHADRLTRCEVRTGDKIHTVVCGAKNHKAGDKVALALPGALLPNGAAIQETEIRKVKSGGMLCSEKELGFAETSEGILILPPDTPEGIPLASALGLNDVILDVNVTPNRGDCLSIRGLAREVAAAFGLFCENSRPKGTSRSESERRPTSIEGRVRVDLQSPELCPRYTCRLVLGVQIGPSPLWVRRRLEACGIRPVNNVVDATNYVMLESGQPLHAFDLSQIRHGQIVIRPARAGETLLLLDGKERSLEKNDLVIADAERVLALAGVMGGEGSGVQNTTTELLLESAYFSPAVVRRAARRLALQTESSYRFERGVDPNGCVDALNRLADLIVQWAGGSAAADSIDVYPKAILPLELRLRRRSLDRVLGYEISWEELEKPFATLGFEKQTGEYSPQERIFKIPTARSDLTREIDLVEEAARLYGYHKIPTRYPVLSLEEIPPPQEHPFDRIRQALLGWGFTEVLHYSFTSPELLQRFGYEPLPQLTLMNPISEELSVMRPSLLPQMLQTLRQNIYRGNKDLKLFELRPSYVPQSDSSPPFREQWKLCLGLSGARRGLHFLEKQEEVGLLDLKGCLKSLLSLAQPGDFQESPGRRPYFHPRRQARLAWAGREIGELGDLHPLELEKEGIRVPVALAEISLDLFLTESKIPVKFQEVSPFPSIWRDLNLIVD